MKTEILLKDNKWEKRNEALYIGSSELTSFSYSDTAEVEKTYGSFAAVKETDDSIILLSDTIGSYPLFYGMSEDTIYISDYGEMIAAKLHSKVIKENAYEFLKTSYVTESETLFKGVYTLLPASIVIINKQSGMVESRHWLEMRYCSNVNYSVTIKDFDKVMECVFTDLIKRLNGRTALIPLSGGGDSRIAAVMLKRLGYKNVVCFTYGKKGNFESVRSKQIADYLGFRHIFIEYNADVWRSLYTSKDYKRFLEFSCRGRTIGCTQALPAIMKIKADGLVSEDSVVIPGHALDFNMGSHIKSELMNAKTNEQIRDCILREHYCLRKTQKQNGNIEKWTGCIDSDSAIGSYMKWEWHNRQCKFIANDVRTYEFMGYDFEMPFWDSRVIEFCAQLSAEQLKGRAFQYDYLSKIINPIAGVSENDLSSNFKSSLKKVIKKIPIAKNIFHVLQMIKGNIFHTIQLMKGDREDGTNAFLSYMTDEEYRLALKKYGHGFNMNTIIAEQYIEMLRKH